ncbi:MAG: PilZ domain-containing protein [Pseudohongiellaceae bacterium]
MSNSSIAGSGAKHGILSLTIKDPAALYAAYMPFLENGGLFVPTTKLYNISDEVFMLLHLMDEADRIPVAGTVVWLTPPNSQGKRAAGIGVHFNDRDNTAKQKIENHLAAQLSSDKPTHTM